MLKMDAKNGPWRQKMAPGANILNQFKLKTFS